VFDADADRARAVAEGATVFADPLSLIASDHIQAVIIASPDTTHADLTLACLEARKAVLCEKPLASLAADALRVVEGEVALNRSHAELVGRSGTVALAPPSLIMQNRNRTGGLTYPENWVPRFADAYRRQLAEWIGAVRTGKPVGASAWDGYVASAIAEEIAAALTENRVATLKLPQRPSLYV
jgi:predicted dehydrogenase